jgi:hypothetical protein
MVGWFLIVFSPFNCCPFACQPNEFVDASPFLSLSLGCLTFPTRSFASFPLPLPPQLSTLFVCVCPVLVWTLVELGVHLHYPCSQFAFPYCLYTSADEGGGWWDNLFISNFFHATPPPLFAFPHLPPMLTLSLCSTHMFTNELNVN